MFNLTLFTKFPFSSNHRLPLLIQTIDGKNLIERLLPKLRVYGISMLYAARRKLRFHLSYEPPPLKHETLSGGGSFSLGKKLQKNSDRSLFLKIWGAITSITPPLNFSHEGRLFSFVCSYTVIFPTANATAC